MRSTEPFRTPGRRKPATEDLALGVGGWLLLATPILAMAALGGAYAPATPLIATVATAAFAFTRTPLRAFRRDFLVAAALVAIGVTAFQLLPLPPLLLRALDPSSAQVSARALSPLRIDRSLAWRPVHADPGTGWAETHWLIGVLCTYLAAVVAARRGNGDKLLALIRWSALGIAVIGIAHRAAGVEKLFGVFEGQQARSPFPTPFMNANHLCALMGVGLVLWLSRALSRRKNEATIGAALAALTCAGVAALSTSRWGVAVAFASAIALIATAPRESRNREVFWGRLIAATVLMGALYLGSELLLVDARARDWSKLHEIGKFLGVVRGHPLLGIGSGGLMASSWRLPIGDGVLAERAECLPIDWAIGFGIPAAIAIAVLAGLWLVRHAPRGSKRSPSLVAAYVALLALGVHDLLDFALFLGGNAYVAALLAGTIAGDRLRSQSDSAPERSTKGSMAVAACVACLSLVAAPVTAFSTLSSEHVRVSGLAASAGVPRDIERSMIRHPGDAYIPLIAASSSLRAGDHRAFRFANRALELAPEWGAAHALVASALLLTGHRSQGLLEMALSAGMSRRHHAMFAANLVQLDATADEVVAFESAGPFGADFVRLVAVRAAERPLGAELDRRTLSRDPRSAAALDREAARAYRARDVVGEEATLRRWLAADPASESPYARLGELYARTSRFDDAAAILSAGLARMPRSSPIRIVLAQVQAGRRETTAMRATMAALLEDCGANLDERARLLGQYGRLEAALGNYALALAQFERAESITAPRHPYAADILAVAVHFNDRSRIRSACEALAESGPLDETTAHRCETLRSNPSPRDMDDGILNVAPQ